MLPTDLSNLTMIPASRLMKTEEIVPAKPGVYLFFIRGGAALLEAANYFECGDTPPLRLGDAIHVYTGAADNLRRRMTQHLRRDARGSSFRKTLLSLEQARRAISRKFPYSRRLGDEDALSRWLYKHLMIGIEVGNQPFARERELIQLYGSPLNISFRRKLTFSRQLMKWRRSAFPR